MKKALAIVLAIVLVLGTVFCATACSPVDNEVAPGRVTPI